ncbi:MAG: hypothetical protein B7C54_12320 [Acidimicrobiales bacterium mtb01]|nr:hypothetical protein [Actinomycetota bacterium]TEX45814.1 MAG: hypothetical protein B7C54_12320 [Acidimicrobiales bacterium mtb01]
MANTMRPEQLTLDGFDRHDVTVPDDLAPLFTLDDETCRIGLEHVAEMRRILDGFADSEAA